MNIKKIINSTLQFTINRVIEIIGIGISIVGLLLFISLISYSPDDPNFIFPENTEIKNLLGFQGSYVSDIFFQSIGIISYLVPITLFITGINIFSNKDLFLIIENLFFSILYCLLGALFLSFFYDRAFNLYINGNGGFVGNYLNQNLFGNLINLQKNISYYILLILIFSLFLVSINFRPKKSGITLKNFFIILIKIAINLIQIKVKLLMNIYHKKKLKI